MVGKAPALVGDLRPAQLTSLRLVLALLLTALVATSDALAQSQESGAPEPARPSSAPRSAGVPVDATLQPTEYRVGVDDVLQISVLQAPELSISVRVAEAGDISLPLIGVIHAASLTTRELEEAIKDRLREGFIREPEVTVLVTEVRSHGVSVVGAVTRPGLIQVRGSTTLLEVLSLAGGLSANAGDSVMVVRPEGKTTRTIDIKLKDLLAADLSANIQLMPRDVVNVQNAALVYVMGAVNKPGAFAMRGNDRLTVLRALAYGEGTAPGADMKEAVVLRLGKDGERVEIPIDLQAVLKGRSPDVDMQAQDLLFVPINGAKSASKATLDYLTRVISLRNLIP